MKQNLMIIECKRESYIIEVRYEWSAGVSCCGKKIK